MTASRKTADSSDLHAYVIWYGYVYLHWEYLKQENIEGKYCVNRNGLLSIYKILSTFEVIFFILKNVQQILKCHFPNHFVTRLKLLKDIPYFPYQKRLGGREQQILTTTREK